MVVISEPEHRPHPPCPHGSVSRWLFPSLRPSLVVLLGHTRPPPCCPSHAQFLGTTDLSSSHVIAGMLWKWNHTACNLWGMAFLLDEIPWRFLKVVTCIRSFFLLLGPVLLWLHGSVSLPVSLRFSSLSSVYSSKLELCRGSDKSRSPRRPSARHHCCWPLTCLPSDTRIQIPTKCNPPYADQRKAHIYFYFTFFFHRSCFNKSAPWF